MTAIRPIIALGIAVSLAACGGTSRSWWEGRWLGNRNLPLRPGENELAIKTIGRVDLTIQGNGRFELFEGGVPKSGRVRFAGDKAYLKVETFFWKPIEAQGDAAVAMNKEIELSRIGERVRFFDPAGFDKEPIILVRQPKPDPASSRN